MRLNQSLRKIALANTEGAFARKLADSLLDPSESAFAELEDKLDSTELDTALDEAARDLYAMPVPSLSHRRMTPKAVASKLKAANLSEERLIHVSEELLKLADEIRYINPLMAEVLDEAWDSTEEAIEMLARDDVW